MQPSVELEDGYGAGKDAAIKVELEVLPDVPAPAIDGLKLARLTAEITDEQIDEAVERIASQQKRYEAAPEGHEAKDGDQVVMDFVGKVDGEAFEGGTGEGMAVVIGSGTLIPGFDDQLVGVKAGEAKTIEVTFPEDSRTEERRVGKECVSQRRLQR